MPVDTKGIIIRAYQELVEERKNFKITVADIVERCGISRKTFYYHFDNIYDLVDVMSTRSLEAFFSSLDSGDMKEDIKKFFLFMEEHKEPAKLLMQSGQFLPFTERLFAKLHGYLVNLLEQKGWCCDRPKAEFDIAARTFTYAILGLSLDGKTQTEEEINRLVDVIYRLGTGQMTFLPTE